jgi:hypothetical protein
MSDGVGFLVLLLAGNIAFVAGTAIIWAVFSVSPAELVEGPFTTNFVSAWRTVASLFLIVDLVSLLSFAINKTRTF